jgi:hypothetical protein
VIKDAVYVDKSKPDTNFEGENLEVGSPSGKPNSEKRILLSFDLESFDEGKNVLFYLLVTEKLSLFSQFIK